MASFNVITRSILLLTLQKQQSLSKEPYLKTLKQPAVSAVLGFFMFNRVLILNIKFIDHVSRDNGCKYFRSNPLALQFRYHILYIFLQVDF